MAEADLDVVIRSMTKKQVKALNGAARQRHGKLMGMAAKAKDKAAKERYRHIAKNTLLLAAAAVRRLQITAENAADSYRRSIRRVAEEAAAIKAPEAKTSKGKTSKAAKKAAKSKTAQNKDVEGRKN